MAIISALPSAAQTTETGTSRLSVVSANVADGDSVEVDGGVVTDDNDNPIAFVNVPSDSGRGSVQSGPSDSELTVNHNVGGVSDVTIFAVVE
jgi:hypothetical protein